MKTIRRNTFETNSSSTHAIAIPMKKRERFNQRVRVYAHIGEFGWEYSNYKPCLDYLYTAILCNYPDDYKEYLDEIEKVADKYNIEIIWDVAEFWTSNSSGDKYLDNGYIDHGYELKDFIKEVMADETLIINAILDGEVATGNDNDGDDVYTETEDGVEYYDYFKGN